MSNLGWQADAMVQGNSKETFLIAGGWTTALRTRVRSQSCAIQLQQITTKCTARSCAEYLWLMSQWGASGDQEERWWCERTGEAPWALNSSDTDKGRGERGRWCSCSWDKTPWFIVGHKPEQKPKDWPWLVTAPTVMSRVLCSWTRVDIRYLIVTGLRNRFSYLYQLKITFISRICTHY